MRVLVVAAHPDDEVLGCGGTLRRHVNAGDFVQTVFTADGVTSRGDGKKAVKQRRKMAQKAASILGTASPRFLEFKDQRLDRYDFLRIVQAIENAIVQFVPDIIYTHHIGDLNLDHAIVHRAVLTAARPLPGSKVVGIFAFETLSSTEWSPNIPFVPSRFVDILEVEATKIKAFEAYASELRPYPHRRSTAAVIANDKLRGTTVGLECAEAFLVIREIVHRPKIAK